MVQIDIYADPVCPWCFIGKRRLERTLAARDDVDATLNWRPFQLNPDMPPEGMDQTSYLISKFGGLERALKFQDAIAETGQGERIAFNFERIRHTPNTLDAHRLIRFAGAQGLQNDVVEALFAA
jgi:predicted DsbA family dithiol-disulfide isomerase